MKALLFDADGVVITPPLSFGAHFQQERNVDASHMNAFYSGIFQECLRGKHDMKDALPEWLKQWGYDGGPDEFMDEWFGFENMIDPRMADLIASARCHGIPCYLVTNQEKYRGNYMRKNMKMESMFNQLFISAEVGSVKPEREFFGYVLAEIIVEPHEILLIDDSIRNIEGAQSIGMQTHHYTGFGALQDALREVLPL